MARRVVKRGSIVLVQFPFSDLSATKVRPAVILTPDSLLPKVNDVLCLFVSSSFPLVLLPTDYILETDHPSFEYTGLKGRAIFRTHKLVSLHKSLVSKVIGEADGRLMRVLTSHLRIATGL